MKNEGLRVLQHTLSALSQPVIAIDSRGVIVAANPPATNLFSADSNALAEKVFDSVFEHPLDALRPCTNQGVAAFGQWQNVVARHDNGKRVPLAICVERLVNNTDELLLLSLRPGREKSIAPSRGIVDSLLQNENLPFLYLDAKSVVLAASPAIARALSLNTDDLINRPIAQLNLSSNLLQGLNIALERREVSHGGATELSLNAVNAPQFWDWFICPITDRRHASVGAIVLLVDATARVNAEAACKKSTLEWTFAMDAFEDCIYLLDLEDRVVRANKAFYKLTRLTPDKVIGRTVGSIMPPMGEPTPCAVCQARIERRDAYIVMEADDPNNKTGRANEIMVRMIRDENEEIIGILMGIHDLTRSRNTAREFRRLNEHIRLLLGSTGEGIIGIDAAGHCTFINRAGAHILGYSPKSIEGRNLHRLIHYAREDGTPYPAEECPMLRTVREGVSIRSTSEVLWRQNGTAIPVNYLCNPIIDKGWVTGAVIVFRDVTETRALTRRLDYLATHDTLTGLFNRHEFESQLEQALKKCGENTTQHVICYCDLDQFKVVNDTCGHAAGDQLLNQLGALFLSRLPKNSTLARLGGDEFGLLFKDCTLDQAHAHISQLRETVREFRFAWKEETFSIGMSIGVVPLDATVEDNTTALSLADAACDMAKDSGRNRIHIYRPGDAELSRRHHEMQWVTRIQYALENNRFELHAQPIKPMHADGIDELQRFEILLRMRDNDDTIIFPDAFLPAAERFNLMPAIDRWVIAQTFNWLQNRNGHLRNIALCTINISGHSLSDESFLDYVVEHLRLSAVPGTKICFELTETAAVSNVARATHFMDELKALGCRFALDDFGSGMSSFGYLKNLPVDFLKIDGNFVRDIDDDPIDYAMVDAINKVGHVMGLQTIAEFVESPNILKKLTEIGVDFAQGIGIAPPTPLA